MTLYHALYLRHNLLCVFGLDSFLRNIVTLTTLQIGSTVEQLLVTGDSIVHCIALEPIRIFTMLLGFIIRSTTSLVSILEF
jgi:hypothetical protein